MTSFDRVKSRLRASPRKWLITGVAGFIGSNLLEALLRLDQRVVGLDNFATGKRENLDEVRGLVATRQWKNFRFIQGDICSPGTCHRACNGVDDVLHQAALGSVPRSMKDPGGTHAANVTGFLNMLVAARDRKVKRFIYASSSSVYGDDPKLPRVEARIGNPLSPYAASKQIGELYAEAFGRSYGIRAIGLRYFNVFGPRQNLHGPYAAVIPRWITAMSQGKSVCIYGDGKTSRDFCYVKNVVQANLLAATVKRGAFNVERHCVFNIACGQRTTLNQLHSLLAKFLHARLSPPPSTAHCSGHPPSSIFHPLLTPPSSAILHPPSSIFHLLSSATHLPPRPGDVPHSHASIAKARRLLGYIPTHDIQRGLRESLDWYCARKA